MVAHRPSSPLGAGQVLWALAHHGLWPTRTQSTQAGRHVETLGQGAWRARWRLSCSHRGSPRRLKSRRLLSPRMALLENRGPRRGIPIGQSSVWCPPSAAIMGRAWGWEWTSCPRLGSPCQSCPQWGSFTHSTGCCRVPGHHNWQNIPHGGDGAQHTWNSRVERGGGQSDQRKHRLSDQPQETVTSPLTECPVRETNWVLKNC